MSRRLTLLPAVTCAVAVGNILVMVDQLGHLQQKAEVRIRLGEGPRIAQLGNVPT